MWAGPYAPANGQSTATSDLRTVPPPANPATTGDKTLVGLIKGVLAGLTAQVPKFNAFSEVAKHVCTALREGCIVVCGSYMLVTHSLPRTTFIARERAERVQIRVSGCQDVSDRGQCRRSVRNNLS